MTHFIVVYAIRVSFALLPRIRVKYMLIDSRFQILEIRIEYVDIALLPQIKWNETELFFSLRVRIRLIDGILLLVVRVFIFFNLFFVFWLGWHWHVDHVVARIVVSVQRLERSRRLVVLLDSILYVKAILLASINARHLGLCHIRCFLLDLLDHIFYPVNCWNVHTRQGLNLQKVSLIVEKPFSQFDLIFLIGHWLVHEVQVHVAALARQNVEFKLEICHLACNLVTVPFKNILLVETKIV